MIDIIEDILPYISGFYTLPWILIGFIATVLIAKITGREKIDRIMKKIGVILLYFFIPLLVFRIFLDFFEGKQIIFAVLVSFVILLMYIAAFFYAKYSGKKHKLTETTRYLYLKTVLTNQGRSSAFIGSAMMAYWPVEAGMIIALGGIALFAVIPYVLSHMHKYESKKTEQVKTLPWFLKLYPWYLIGFVIAAIVISTQTGITTEELGNIGSILKFYTAITIPAALYYIGASIHPSDLKISELRHLLGVDKSGEKKEHWTWVRNIFILTVIITPVMLLLIFTPLLAWDVIPGAWFAVIIINAFLPITSTNMFLVPYGIDKKATAHAVTWTTIVCVPIVVILITVFGIYL